MSPAVFLRRARHLSTATTAAAGTKPVTISYLRNKIKKIQDPDEALKVYGSFTADSPHPTSSAATRNTQETIVRLLAKSHRFSDIETFLEGHKTRPEIKDEAFITALIRSYGAVRMFENALKTYNEMSDLGTTRSSLSFNTLLCACIDSKLFDRVPVYFNELPAKYGFLPDKFSYGILIKSYCEMGLPDTAMEKLKEMEEKGFEVGAIVFSTILHSLYKKGWVDEAKTFWDEMMKQGCKPDVGSYYVKLMHIHRGEPEGVKALIKEMSAAEITPDTISYNYLITCYCVNGMMDEAKKTYDELLKAKGCRPNAATFRTMVFHLCKHERYVTGYKVFKESVKVRKIPDFNTLKYLAAGLAEKGHKVEAKGMIRTMNKKFPSNLLKAWGELAEDLGLAPVGTEENDSGERKGVDTGATETASK